MKRERRLMEIIRQAECQLHLDLRSRKFVVVRSLLDYPEEGTGVMIDMTADIDSFIWTGMPSPQTIVAKAIAQVAESDKRTSGKCDQ